MPAPFQPDSVSLSSAAEPWHQVLLGKDSLRYLANFFAIQSVVVAVFVAAFHFSWGFALPQRLLVLFLPAQFVVTLLVYRLALKLPQVKTWHYLLLLMVSVLMLGWFLHDSGGHTNPLISLLLVPLAMSAALLGWQASACLALVILAIYAGLMQVFIPLLPGGDGHQHHAHEQMMQLHLFGMWVTFCLSVLLILVFVIPLATSIRKQRELIARQREQSLQDERIIAMATFAASAAHQLGTPLSTLSVIAEDLADDFADNPALQEDLKTMTEQIALCKNTLHSMMRRADALRNQEQQERAVPEFLTHLREQFNLLNPSRTLRLQLPQVSPAPRIACDETLEQAILNLLDNAARASGDDPAMEFAVADGEVCIRILDTGPGLAPEVEQAIGQPYISTRPRNEGMGLGLFLSHATINRLGGRLKISTGERGTCTEVWLPRLTTGAPGHGEGAGLRSRPPAPKHDKELR